MKVNQVIVAAAFVTLLLRADQVWADAVLAGVTVGTQAPASIAPGESAKFPMMVSKTGIGSLDAYLSISGLPAGAAAAFSPEKVSFTAYSRPSLPATLTISTEPSTQPGAYPFVVTARHGSSKKFEIANGTLVIGNSPRFPNQPLLLIESLPERNVRLICVATPGQVYHIEATTDLASPQWSTISTQSADGVGFFAFIDLDATNYPSRFYRTSRSY